MTYSITPRMLQHDVEINRTPDLVGTKPQLSPLRNGDDWIVPLGDFLISAKGKIDLSGYAHVFLVEVYP